MSSFKRVCLKKTTNIDLTQENVNWSKLMQGINNRALQLGQTAFSRATASTIVAAYNQEAEIYGEGIKRLNDFQQAVRRKMQKNGQPQQPT